MNFLKSKFQIIYLSLLILTIISGIAFRLYQFDERLRFNPDQARDASIVSSYIKGDTALPLLGPKAGGTNFQLGPIFYYFQIISSKIFGLNPVSSAYPDLFFSLLSLWLIWILWKKYFSSEIALSLVALYAVSPFMIKYSRFAWNPNSLPFFILLFLIGLIQIIERKSGKEKFFWSIIAALGWGTAVQLHSLILFTIPPFLIVLIAISFFKRRDLIGYLWLIVLLGLLVNFSQFYSEWKTGGANTQGFVSAIIKKDARNKSLIENVKTSTLCTIEANVQMAFSLGSDEDCGNWNKKNYKTKHWPLILAEWLFFLGGIALFIKKTRTIQEKNRQAIWMVIAGFFLIEMLILIPVANELSMRYFLTLTLLPFFLLGLYLGYIENVFNEKGLYFRRFIILGLISFNIFSFCEKWKEDSINKEIIWLPEAQTLAIAIENNAQTDYPIIISGKDGELFQIKKPVVYFLLRDGFKVSETPEEQGQTFILTRTPKRYLEAKKEVLARSGGYTIFKN